MWRHITGIEQPAKKIKLDYKEKLERKRTYDQVKRKRKFQTSWQKNCMFHTYDIPSYDPTDAINLWNLTGQRTRDHTITAMYSDQPVLQMCGI
jgi:hypothetical protein